jgi:hypothetical protein
MVSVIGIFPEFGSIGILTRRYSRCSARYYRSCCRSATALPISWVSLTKTAEQKTAHLQATPHFYFSAHITVMGAKNLL